MSFRMRQFWPLCLLTCAATTLHAQAIPIRELAVSETKSGERFGNIFSVRQLTGGRVLVNDGVRRQLVILDANLADRKVLVDSVVEGGQSYGSRAAPFIPYLGDSTLFVDEASLSFVLIDPAGKITRVMSPPKAKDMLWLTRGTSGVDHQGNLVYRSMYPSTRIPASGNTRAKFVYPDSAPLIRANFETRVLDTIGTVKIQPTVPVDESKDAKGNWIMKITLNPLPLVDEWAVLSNGTVAMVRGADYHIDLVEPDGTRRSAPKLPFDFRRLTDADKQLLVDSARAAEEKRRATAVPMPPQSGREAAIQPTRPSMPPLVEFVPFSALPDYYPPIRNGATKADADGNLWILPTTSARSLKGELVYD
ncbi:MAG: hypothetical protein H7Z40_11110, partial [Phycisphaerae bacterium]|nr:hypothetical protein [Gemmatimonadaceae bacterium]